MKNLQRTTVLGALMASGFQFAISGYDTASRRVMSRERVMPFHLVGAPDDRSEWVAVDSDRSFDIPTGQGRFRWSLTPR